MSTRHIRFLCGQRTLLSSLNTSAPVHVRGRCPASTAAAVHESSDPSAQRTHQSEDLKPFSAIPGPKPLPLLRNLLQFKRNSSRLNPYLEECYNKYGEIFKLEAPGQQACPVVSSVPPLPPPPHTYLLSLIPSVTTSPNLPPPPPPPTSP